MTDTTDDTKNTGSAAEMSVNAAIRASSTRLAQAEDSLESAVTAACQLLEQGKSAESARVAQILRHALDKHSVAARAVAMLAAAGIQQPAQAAADDAIPDLALMLYQSLREERTSGSTYSRNHADVVLGVAEPLLRNRRANFKNPLWREVAEKMHERMHGERARADSILVLGGSNG